MLIIHEYNRPYVIDSISTAIAAKYFWTFSGDILDFKLSPIMYLEELTGPVIELIIGGFKFKVPASWHMLIVDVETTLVDTVLISECAKNNFKAFLSSSKDAVFRVADIKINDYIEDEVLVYPMINRDLMMCHPIGPTPEDEDNFLSIVIGPHDLYKCGLQYVSAKEILYA